jgi:hypothetical protein
MIAVETPATEEIEEITVGTDRHACRAATL